MLFRSVVVSSFEAHGQYDLSTPQAVGPETLMDPEGARVDVELEEGVLSVVVHQA